MCVRVVRVCIYEFSFLMNPGQSEIKTKTTSSSSSVYSAASLFSVSILACSQKPPCTATTSVEVQVEHRCDFVFFFVVIIIIISFASFATFVFVRFAHSFAVGVFPESLNVLSSRW